LVIKTLDWISIKTGVNWLIYTAVKRHAPGEGYFIETYRLT